VEGQRVLSEQGLERGRAYDRLNAHDEPEHPRHDGAGAYEHCGAPQRTGWYVDDRVGSNDGARAQPAQAAPGTHAASLLESMATRSACVGALRRARAT
jgi:hypothetical protein